jgi:5-methylcytosine-specific restriction endonuclease McrA
MLFGLYGVVEGRIQHTSDERLGFLTLAVGTLPVIAWGGAWFIRRWWRRRTQQRLARPLGPVAFSREPIPAGLRFAVLRRDGFRCAYCGRGEAERVRLHIDHLVPVARGGRTVIDNLVTACQDCNLGKSASDLIGA